MKAEIIREALREIEGVTLLSSRELQRWRVPAGETCRLVVLHEAGAEADGEICLEPGARLQLTEIFVGESSRRITLKQEAESLSDVTLLMMESASAHVTTELNAPHAESRLNGLFLVAEGEHCEVNIRTRHLSSDCNSYSLVKGVASGEGAYGRFDGLVYVAPDAQRTDARQTSRNIELTPGARIQTLPQLEIYADDVKCSHGATVGQLDGEAILYMRQRGLSEKQARRLQIEGFAGDVVCHHENQQLGELLCSLVSEKLQTM